MRRKTHRPRSFSLTWIFESIEDHPTFGTRRMFGCLAAYTHHKMMLVLAENPGDRTYKRTTFPFDIWNGLLLPTEREFHESLKKTFPNLVNHPVLPKWLYLPMSDESFETTALELAELVRRNDPRVGIVPKAKTRTGRGS